MIDNRVLGELKFEIDSCYVSAELALGQKYPESLVNALLLEACFLHFRVVWDFFYGTRQAETDVLLRDFLPGKIPKALRPKKPPRLQEIRTSLDETLAHLTTKRIGPGFKAGRITSPISNSCSSISRNSSPLLRNVFPLNNGRS